MMMISQYAIPKGWDTEAMPELDGKRFLITGGTSGLGRAMATELTRHGGHVTITARDMKKGQEVIDQIGRGAVVDMDLTDLSSVRRAADQLRDQNEGNPFNAVILNAGVMATPLKSTVDGFELQMGTNHLGHFAFAGLIRNLIGDRLVTVASQAHRTGSFGSGSIEDIRNKCLGIGSYSPWGSYGSSKLANLLFTNHLERLRLQHGWSFTPHAAHPGYANTNLQRVGPQLRGNVFEERLMVLGNATVAQSAVRGALPILCAATFPAIPGASYLGPDGFMEMRGHPKFTRARAMAYDQVLATNLWQVSEELTGVSWETSTHATGF
jgi:NAD(P)-dependent dehydrogenase (short-subunit alcohol dehydrogenase family)